MAVSLGPTGLTLDNIVLPGSAQGTVVQVLTSINKNFSNQSWSGTANANILYGSNRYSRTFTVKGTVTITPKSTDNFLFCIGSVGWSSMTATATQGHGQIITRNDGSDSIDNADYPWYAHNYITSSSLYYPAETVVGIFTPASTSAQTIRLRPYVYVEGGNTATGSINNASLIVMEIAG